MVLPQRTVTAVAPHSSPLRPQSGWWPPMKEATNCVLGCSYISRGDPSCSTTPAVHNGDGVGHGEGLLLVMGDKDGGDIELSSGCLRISRRISLRSLASRLDRGSSRSSKSGFMTRARARATRVLLAAAQLPGIALAEALHPHHFQAGLDAALGLVLGHTVALEAIGDVLLHGHVGGTGRSSGRPCRWTAYPAAQGQSYPCR